MNMVLRVRRARNTPKRKRPRIGRPVLPIPQCVLDLNLPVQLNHPHARFFRGCVVNGLTANACRTRAPPPPSPFPVASRLSTHCFGAILKVDENFHLQQEHLEKTAVDLLRSRIQERVARRQLTSGNRSASIVDGGMRRGQTAFSAASSAASVDFLVRNQTRLGAPLAAADWQAVVDYVYKTTPADARTVAFLVKKAILMRRHKDRELRGTTRKGGREQEVRGSVPYGVFIQVLLEYQLHGHLRFLKLFKRDFREVGGTASGSRMSPSLGGWMHRLSLGACHARRFTIGIYYEC